MPLKKFVFRQISRYICTRRIQFTLQNLHIVFFSNNDDVICCFIGRGKDVFTVKFFQVGPQLLSNRTFLWRCLCCHFALLTFLLV